ncbi:hypothetical protein M8J77_002947 [Diaphorina citri]|jgi:Zinc finger, C2H2 type.|nr:hypothetical protein M8J77_002947 [Diaphorina citri]
MASYTQNYNFFYNNTGEVEINPNYFDNGASGLQHPHQYLPHFHEPPPSETMVNIHSMIPMELPPTMEVLAPPPQLIPNSTSKPVKDRPFQCETCFRRFSLKKTLQQHILTHTGERPFPCPLCPKRFSRQDKVHRHMLVHTGEKPFACTACDKRFGQKGSLMLHLKLHQDAPKEFRCSVCWKEFTRKVYLSRHLATHDERPRLKCACCERDFLNKESLRQHEKNQERRRSGLQVMYPKRKSTVTVSVYLTCKGCLRKFRRIKTSRSVTHVVLNEYCLTCGARLYTGTAKLSAGIIKEFEIFECPTCNATFRKASSFEQHKLLHSEAREFECDYCHLRFRTKTFVRSHIAKHVACKYQCHMCGLKFRYAKKLKSHYVQHVDEFVGFDIADYVKTFECHLCADVLYQRHKMIKHLQGHEIASTDEENVTNQEIESLDPSGSSNHQLQPEEIGQNERIGEACGNAFDKDIPDIYDDDMDYNDYELTHGQTDQVNQPEEKNRPFSCTVCKKSFPQKVNLKRHFVVKHKECEKERCDICGKEFKSKDSLKQHQLIHKPHRFKCDHCDRTFHQKNAFLSHLRHHSKTKAFQCTVCKKSFAKEICLKRHFVVQHTEYEKERCDFCRKEFKTKKSLQQHYLLHTPHSFKCDHCDRTFSRKDSLLSHLRLHSKTKAFQCAVCKKSFFQKQTLSSHMARHKERAYACTVCGKQFYLKSTLNTHALTHSDTKTFHCDVCEKSFYTRQSLYTHVARHREEKLQCSLCEKQYPDRSRLNRHYLSHSRPKRQKLNLQCKYCEKTFCRHFHYARHTKWHEKKGSVPTNDKEVQDESIVEKIDKEPTKSKTKENATKKIVKKKATVSKKSSRKCTKPSNENNGDN